MFPLAIMIVSQDLFEPMSLLCCDRGIYDGGVMEDCKFLTAAITPKSSHFSEPGLHVAHLAFLDRHCLHEGNPLPPVLYHCGPQPCVRNESRHELWRAFRD